MVVRRLVCSPVDGARTGGSVLRVAGCGHEVWLSVGGQAVVERSGCVLVCARCVPVESVVAGFEVPREVAEDLVREVGAAEARRVLACAADPVWRVLLFEALRAEGLR